jgi:hypothetical protein
VHGVLGVLWEILLTMAGRRVHELDTVLGRAMGAQPEGYATGGYATEVLEEFVLFTALTDFEQYHCLPLRLQSS